MEEKNQGAAAPHTARLVQEYRQQIEREYLELVRELRVRCVDPKSCLAEYRSRRAEELARWNRWPTAVQWAIAEDRP